MAATPLLAVVHVDGADHAQRSGGAIRHAERDDLAERNVAALIENLPKG